jgi:hypothetical protein
MTLFDQYGDGINPTMNDFETPKRACDAEPTAYRDGLWERTRSHLDVHLKTAVARDCCTHANVCAQCSE